MLLERSTHTHPHTHSHSGDEHCYVTPLKPEDVCILVSLFHYEDDDEDDDDDDDEANGMTGCDAHLRDVWRRNFLRFFPMFCFRSLSPAFAQQKTSVCCTEDILTELCIRLGRMYVCVCVDDVCKLLY
jgi:hypothetical protein